MEMLKSVQEAENPTVREGAFQRAAHLLVLALAVRCTLPYGRVSASLGNKFSDPWSNHPASSTRDGTGKTGGAEMFTNLIESASHVREYKRRSSFFLITVATYAVILFAAGIVSVYAYDAQLESQAGSLELLNWVPPVTAAPKPVRDNHPQVVRRSTPATAPVDRNITVSERREAIPLTNDPRLVPKDVGIKASDIKPVTGPVRITGRDVDPPFDPSGDKAGCVTCTGTPTVVRVETDSKPPEPPVVKPKTERVTSIVLTSKAISLPQPAYPAMARQIRLQGPVNVQILVDEQGKVVSAQIVSGHPILSSSAKDAAMRARFTPTVLNGKAVKIQGVITYNFVLQ